MLHLAVAVLVVIAHPDDETLFGGFLYALTHQLHATVDLACITNGEGGFAHSSPSESLYGHLRLSEEQTGRQHLPRIRKQELLSSGKILGIRKYFLYDQFDLKYGPNVDTVLSDQWDQELIIRLLERTIKAGNAPSGYDLLLVMLPNVQSHGHHTASALLALEAIRRLQQNQSNDTKIPLVIGGSEFLLTEIPSYPLNPLADVISTSPNEFQFNRTWKLNNADPIPDYRMIILWLCGEHKSQGGLIAETLSTLTERNEQYFYFALNNPARLHFIESLFKDLSAIHSIADGTPV